MVWFFSVTFNTLKKDISSRWHYIFPEPLCTRRPAYHSEIITLRTAVSFRLLFLSMARVGSFLCVLQLQYLNRLEASFNADIGNGFCECLGLNHKFLKPRKIQCLKSKMNNDPTNAFQHISHAQKAANMVWW